MIRRPGREGGGFALPLVLLTLVIAAALLAGAAQLAWREDRAVQRERAQTRAHGRAETGMAAMLASWTPARLSRLLPMPFDSLVVRDGDGWEGRVRRLNEGLVLIDATGIDSLARVRLGRLVQARPLVALPAAALAARGPVALGAGSAIRGTGSSPSPTCPPDSGSIGLITTGAVTLSDDAAISGSPPVVTLTSGLDSAREALYQRAYAALAEQATIVLPPGGWAPHPTVSGGRCDVATLDNWGDPLIETGPCSSYWPIVHVTGDAQLQGGEGEGILLVDGDLDASGVNNFSGVLIVRGRLKGGSGGGILNVEGSVVAATVGPPLGAIIGLTVAYSKCFVQMALATSGAFLPVPSRSWKQLF